MITTVVNTLTKTIKSLQDSIVSDIEDVKKANHDKLLERNDLKLDLMDNLKDQKEQLNQELAKQYHNGVDISQYKDSIDAIEDELRTLYELNGKLASIVLPVKEMYKEIIDEITHNNGGSLIEVMA